MVDLPQVVDAWEWRIYLNIALNLIGAAGVLVSIFVSLRNRQHIIKLSVEIDGRMQDFLKIATLEAAAQGKLDGRAEQLVEREREAHPPLLGLRLVEGTLETSESGNIVADLHPKLGDDPE